MEPHKDSFDVDYDVFEEIGKGHFAVVKRCVRKTDGQLLAGKFIRKKRVCRGVPLEDINREIQTLAQLQHPGIIKLHEVYDTGQSIVLMLELVGGGELHQFVSDDGCLTEPQSIHIMKQILDALAHLHSKNIAHLDLKPENVLLVERVEFPQVKVIDFGLSQRLDTVADTRALFGTAEFVAPEIVNYEKVSLATDMWAVGVITYILLSGASPFLGDTTQETYSNVSQAVYEFDAEYFHSVSDAAKDFIARLLLKDPKKRDTVFDSVNHPWLQDKVPEILSPPVTLFSTIEDGDMATFEDILNSGRTNIDQTNKRGETGLHIAARHGREEMARLLIMCGANSSAQDSLGDTPLICAARSGSLPIATMLINAGACVSAQNQEGETALHIAAGWGELGVVRILVESGGMLHIPDHMGRLPLHVAIARARQTIALFLLNAGTDFDLHDSEGNAPIHLAVREGLYSVVQALCSLGCFLDSPNNMGLCPIHIAARFGFTDIVRCLCLAGCDTEIKNSDGIKAEITALKYGYNDISDLLNKIRSNYSRNLFYKQLLGTGEPLPRFNIQVFGQSGVGKSTLVEGLRTSYIQGLFKRSKSASFSTSRTNILTSMRSQPSSPRRTQIELDSTSRQNSLNFDIYSHHSTKGIDVQQAWVGSVGDVTFWDFSGQDTYFCLYHHFINPRHSLFLLVVNLEDSYTLQYKQASFWLTFIQSRLPPTEPIDNYSLKPTVVVVATHSPYQSEYDCPQMNDLVTKLDKEYRHYFHLHPTPLFVDAHLPNSYGMKQLKNTIGDIKHKLSQDAIEGSLFSEGKILDVPPEILVRKNGTKGLMSGLFGPRGYQLLKEPRIAQAAMTQGFREMTGLCDAVIAWLPTMRKAAPSVPVISFQGFMDEVRSAVNPLASETHFTILLDQLQLLGEVICIDELVVLSPNWLCSQVLGQLLSLDFITHARVTGSYTVEDFQSAFPEAEALPMLQVLEALHIAVQCEVDGEFEFELPIYNLIERLDGLWEATDPRYLGGIYGGLRIKPPVNTVHLLHSIFPRIQVELRLRVATVFDWENDLYQWLGGSKLCLGPLEALLTLESQAPGGADEYLEVKVRGPPNSAPDAFLFLEEILGIIDIVMVEMLPGLAVEKHYLSPNDLKHHVYPPHCYSPQDLSRASMKTRGLETSLQNPQTKISETVLDIIAFSLDKSWVVEGVMGGIGSLSSPCISELCKLLDPAEPKGRDWCLLAVSLGLTASLPHIEMHDTLSKTWATLNLYSSLPENNIRNVIKKLEGLGREDAADVLLRLAPLYLVTQSPGCPNQLPPPT